MNEKNSRRPLLYGLLTLGPFGPVAKRLSLLAQTGLWPRVGGARHVPRRGPLVIAAAHPSIFDLPAVDIAVKRHFEVILDERFLAVPLLGWLFRVRGAHALRRTLIGFDERNLETFARAADLARSGGAVLIFPSGWGFKVGSGVARLAAASQAPVLPLAIYHVEGNRAHPRTLVAVRRPVAPPADDPAARRRFIRRWRRRHRRLGLEEPPHEEAAAAFSMALDDPRLWRRPSAVIRRGGRLARLAGPDLERFLRVARALRRGCDRLRCSVGDLRSPPGAGVALAYLVVGPAAAIGYLLCLPVLIAVRIAFARAAIGGRGARRAFGIALAPAYGLALGALGAAWLGPAGWLLPLAALAGICAAGIEHPLQHRCRCLVAVRRHGHRLRRLLAAFDRAGR